MADWGKIFSFRLKGDGEEGRARQVLDKLGAEYGLNTRKAITYALLSIENAEPNPMSQAIDEMSAVLKQAHDLIDRLADAMERGGSIPREEIRQEQSKVQFTPEFIEKMAKNKRADLVVKKASDAREE